MSWKCFKCKKIIKQLEGGVKCPHCGYRIFHKERPAGVIKKVRTD